MAGSVDLNKAFLDQSLWSGATLTDKQIFRYLAGVDPLPPRKLSRLRLSYGHRCPTPPKKWWWSSPAVTMGEALPRHVANKILRGSRLSLPKEEPGVPSKMSRRLFTLLCYGYPPQAVAAITRVPIEDIFPGTREMVEALSKSLSFRFWAFKFDGNYLHWKKNEKGGNPEKFLPKVRRLASLNRYPLSFTQWGLLEEDSKNDILRGTLPVRPNIDLGPTRWASDYGIY